MYKRTLIFVKILRTYISIDLWLKDIQKGINRVYVKVARLQIILNFFLLNYLHVLEFFSLMNMGLLLR